MKGLNPKRILIAVSVFSLGIAAASALWAQQPTPPPKTAGDDVVIVNRAIRFNNGGRMDPFVDLEVRKEEMSKTEELKIEPIPSFEERQRKFPGVRGLLLRELKLQGVVQRTNEKVAYFFGADNKAHFIRAGEELYNAKVKKITLQSVTFEEYKRYTNKTVDRSVVTVTLHE